MTQIKHTSALALVTGLAVGLPAVLAAAATDLPVRAITLHRSGVASVERLGTITGDDTVTLTFGTDQINDVLKSMVFVDTGGGTIGRVGYGSREPIARRLASFGLDIGDNPNIADIINRLRGERVRLKTPEGTTEGTILGVEHRKEASDSGDVLVDVWHAKLVTSFGMIRMVRLDDLRGMELLDETLAEELAAALAALASGRNDRTADITLDLRGTGPRDVAISYVQEAPVWKTSYRIVLPDEDAASHDGVYVQGWAIVENTTDEDWTDVRLSLAAGRPVGFTMDLAEPLYSPRRKLPVPVMPGVSPRRYASGTAAEVRPVLYPASRVATAEAADGLTPPVGRSAAGFDPELHSDMQASLGIASGRANAKTIAESMLAAATATDTGRTFRFDLDSPITVERQASAMLPILGSTIEGRSVSVFTPGAGMANPMRAVSIENTSGSPLMAGPVAVYDGGAYAGDAPMDYVAAGESRILGYAVDLDVTVTPEVAQSRQIQSVKIADGMLVRTSKEHRETTYTVTNNDEREGRTVLIEHRRLGGWTLAGDAEPIETTPDEYRFELQVDASGSATLTTGQRRTTRQTVAMLDGDLRELAVLVRGGQASQAVLDAVREAGRLNSAITSTKNTIAALQNEEREIFRDQERIRQNLSRVQSSGDLRARYLRTLDEQETRLVAIRDSVEAAQATLEANELALRSYLRDLDVE